MIKELVDTYDRAGFLLWFNGASDHFFEFEVPERFKNTEIGLLSEKLKDKCLEIGHGFRLDLEKTDMKEIFDEVFQNLEKLSMLIDKELGVDVVETTYE